MNTRSIIHAALLLASLPLVACSSPGDDDTGQPAAQASPWAGHTYALITTQFDWTSPRGLGQDIENVMPVFMFQVTAASGKDVTVRMGTAPKVYDPAGDPTDTVVQDMCSPTVEIPVSGAAYPSSQIGPTDAQLHLVNDASTADPADDVQVTATVYGLQFKDILPNGATKSEMGRLTATMDFRELAPLFTAIGHPPTDAAVCDAVSNEQNACQPCKDGHVSCISAIADLIGAVDHPGLTVMPVDLNTRPATCKNTF